MSWAYVAAVFGAGAQLACRPPERLVLLVLADCANKGHSGQAWPSIDTISRSTGIGARQVRGCLRALEAAQWITRVGTGVGGKGRATTYQLNLTAIYAAKRRNNERKGGERVPGMDGAKGGERVPRIADRKGGGFAPKGGQRAPERRRTGAAEPESTRSLEPEVRAREDAEPQHDGGTPLLFKVSTPGKVNGALLPLPTRAVEARRPKTAAEMEVERERQLALVRAMLARKEAQR